MGVAGVGVAAAGEDFALELVAGEAEEGRVGEEVAAVEGEGGGVVGAGGWLGPAPLATRANTYTGPAMANKRC